MNPSIENNGYWVYQGYPMPYYPLPTQPFVFPPLFEPNFLPNKVENHLDEKFSQVSVKKQEFIIEKEKEKYMKKEQEFFGECSQKQKKDQVYNPKKQNKNKKVLKIYEKDDNRNIIPNIINQLFSFLQKKFKSEKILIKMLKIHPLLQQDEDFLKKFYLYHKCLKTKLNRHLNENSLKMLLEIIDPVCELFNFDTQKKIIKANVILIRSFLMKEQHLLQVISGKRISREKLGSYLSAFRRIKTFVFGQIQNLRIKGDLEKV